MRCAVWIAWRGQARSCTQVPDTFAPPKHSAFVLGQGKRPPSRVARTTAPPKPALTQSPKRAPSAGGKVASLDPAVPVTRELMEELTKQLSTGTIDRLIEDMGRAGLALTDDAGAFLLRRRYPKGKQGRAPIEELVQQRWARAVSFVSAAWQHPLLDTPDTTPLSSAPSLPVGVETTTALLSLTPPSLLDALWVSLPDCKWNDKSMATYLRLLPKTASAAAVRSIMESASEQIGSATCTAMMERDPRSLPTLQQLPQYRQLAFPPAFYHACLASLRSQPRNALALYKQLYGSRKVPADDPYNVAAFDSTQVPSVMLLEEVIRAAVALNDAEFVVAVATDAVVRWGLTLETTTCHLILRAFPPRQKGRPPVIEGLVELAAKAELRVWWAVLKGTYSERAVGLAGIEAITECWTKRVSVTELTEGCKWMAQSLLQWHGELESKRDVPPKGGWVYFPVIPTLFTTGRVTEAMELMVAMGGIGIQPDRRTLAYLFHALQHDTQENAKVMIEKAIHFMRNTQLVDTVLLRHFIAAVTPHLSADIHAFGIRESLEQIMVKITDRVRPMFHAAVLLSLTHRYPSISLAAAPSQLLGHTPPRVFLEALPWLDGDHRIVDLPSDVVRHVRNASQDDTPHHARLIDTILGAMPQQLPADQLFLLTPDLALYEYRDGVETLVAAVRGDSRSSLIVVPYSTLLRVWSTDEGNANEWTLDEEPKRHRTLRSLANLMRQYPELFRIIPPAAEAVLVATSKALQQHQGSAADKALPGSTAVVSGLIAGMGGRQKMSVGRRLSPPCPSLVGGSPVEHLLQALVLVTSKEVVVLEDGRSIGQKGVASRLERAAKIREQVAAVRRWTGVCASARSLNTNAILAMASSSGVVLSSRSKSPALQPHYEDKDLVGISKALGVV